MLNLDNRCTENKKFLPELLEITEKDSSVCPVDWALQITRNARQNVCGKSVFCRDGLAQIDQILSDAVSGEGKSEDIELLTDILDAMEIMGCEYIEEISKRIKTSITSHFDEWESHIKRKRCSALVCKSYYTIHVNPAVCTGAGECLPVCEAEAISGGEGLISVINNQKCTRCGKCIEFCPNNAIVKAGAKAMKVPEAPVPVGSFGDVSSGGTTRRRRRG
jgi:Fe-S-cluster-containing hydrogenase component 2